MKRHLTSLFDLTADDMKDLFDRAQWMKKARREGKPHRALEGKSLAMIFEKSSTRTRVSFEVGMFELGGHALNLTSQGSQLGRGETYEDTARVLSRYVHGIMVRTFAHTTTERFARAATVPVINGLDDLYHPCQVMADMLTVQEHKGAVRDCTVAYVGDGNNLANTWITASMILGFPLRIATPKGFEPAGEVLSQIAKGSAGHILITNDPVAAVKDADVVNTDTWVSMGQEGAGEAEKKKLFQPYQVNRALMSHARKDAIVLHCLPAHRNEEITDEVMDGPQSRILDQAENRLHIQKAIMEALMK